jgi:hypothetical protein
MPLDMGKSQIKNPNPYCTAVKAELVDWGSRLDDYANGCLYTANTKYGSEGGIRTPDQSVNSRLLYH